MTASDQNKDIISEEELVHSFDEMILLLMRFLKKQILEESVQNSVITPPQFGMLHCLQMQGPRTMKEISEQMDLTHGASTGLIDRLHRLGLVERERDDKDRRVVNVTITDEGKQLIERVNQRRHAILSKIVQQLSPDERRLIQKLNSLAKEKFLNYAD